MLTRYRFRFVLLLMLVATPATLAEQDGDGSVAVTGELKQWHKVTLTVAGPYARETDTDPNPFTDYNLSVTFTHESGKPSYTAPGYFAADGDAGENSATEGNKWRAHLSPDKPGRWTYAVSFRQGRGVALEPVHRRAADASVPVVPCDGKTGSFEVAETDKTGRDLRAHGRLEYVGKGYLRFAGSGEYFLKAGADAPETLLAYADFDNTLARKKDAPLKTYAPHVRDWREGDPAWQGGKGKGLIGAINYLSSTGCNAFSFLTYNAGGDGDNVWPFIERDTKLHYDCSKLDQWQVVFDHAQARGMYLHFKLQETEIDDNRRGRDHNADVPTALDGGDLGPERRLYCREMIARFGYLLALNWNLGEENTQSTEQQRAMADYIKAIDPYDHHIVVHTYPNQQDRVYNPLLGGGSVLTGASLQNSDVRDCHAQTLKWVKRSAEAGRPWVVAFDEPGEASFGTPPDPDYPGMERHQQLPATVDDVRKHALWGTLMAGGAGVEYYFGYKLPQNDLNCEDWRSRAKTWAYSAIALAFFRDHEVPFWEMQPRDDLVSTSGTNQVHCLAKKGEMYLVYTHQTTRCALDLSHEQGKFKVFLFNPRLGGALVPRETIEAGGKVPLNGNPKASKESDWVVLYVKQ